MHPAILILCGPTASGKSLYATRLCETLNGVVINADSMQVYKELRVITARPTEAEEQTHPHRLYGYISITEPYSVMRWVEDATREVTNCIKNGKTPIVVSGTGMYLKGLMEGLSPIPTVPQAVRDEVKLLYDGLGEAAFRAELAKADPEIAARLKPNDAQRLKRAMEVLKATGEPLSRWQSIARTPPLPGARFQVISVDIPRDVLYQRCDARFDSMLKNGALDEAKSVQKQGFDRSLPGMKAVGLPELLAYLEGNMTLEEAGTLAKQMTRNYAKRQFTWIRNQLKERLDVPYDAPAPVLAEITEKLRKFIDHSAPKD